MKYCFVRSQVRGKPSSNGFSETLVKRETALTSESAQFILAWRSKDSVESASNSQSEAQPGIGCNAIPEAAQSGGSKKPGARAVSQKA